MIRVVRVRVSGHPLTVLVPAQGGVGTFRVTALREEDEDSLLWEVRCRYADRADVLPEDVRLVTFRDVSWADANGKVSA